MRKAGSLGIPVMRLKQASGIPILLDHATDKAQGVAFHDGGTFVKEWLAKQEVHGMPLRVFAYPIRQAEGKKVYSLHCRSCKPTTCRWKPTVLYSAGLKAWAVRLHPGNCHGDPITNENVDPMTKAEELGIPFITDKLAQKGAELELMCYKHRCTDGQR